MRKGKAKRKRKATRKRKGRPSKTPKAALPDQAFPSWSSLPDDLVHVILANICLTDLARITTTCSSFRAAYREQMAREQEARRKLVVSTFGADWTACVLALIVRLLKTELLPSGFINRKWNRFRISSDGVLHGPVSPASPDMSENGDIRGSFWTDRFLKDRFSCSHIHVVPRNLRAAMLEIVILHEEQYVHIDVTPTNDEDLLPVALVQALLSDGLTQSISDVGHSAMVDIGAAFMETGFTQPGLKAQIVPLLPFASQYTCGEATGGEPVKECMMLRQW